MANINEILDWSKLRTHADDKINVTQRLIFVSSRLETIQRETWWEKEKMLLTIMIYIYIFFFLRLGFLITFIKDKQRNVLTTMVHIYNT